MHSRFRSLLLWLALAALGTSMNASATLPVSLEENAGQIGNAPGVYFLARAEGYTLGLGGQQPVFYLANGRQIAMHVRGVKRWPKPEAAESLAQRSNYFSGQDRSQWKTGIRHYGRAVYRNLLPGVDLHFYGTGTEMEYDFVLAPGVDPSVITVDFPGADKVALDPEGNLELSAGAAKLRHRKPVVFQRAGKPLPSRLAVNGRGVTFAVGEFDRKLPLTIDPVVEMSTLFPGGGRETVKATAVDGNGNIYIAGNTYGPGIPVTTGVVGPGYVGGNDAFIAKLSADGKTVLAVTYLGGSSDENLSAMAITASGSVVVAGTSSSSNFPTTASSYKPYLGVIGARSGLDGFVTSLSPGLNVLDFSTFLGGAGTDDLATLTIAPGGEIAVGGYTGSTDFPVSANAYRRVMGGFNDGYVAVLTGNGTGISYASYIGGNAYDYVSAIRFDATGAMIVAGYTASTDFFTTEGAYKTTAGAGDVFIQRFASVGPNLVASTLFGGPGEEQIVKIDADNSGNIFVAGVTTSTSFPTTAISAKKTPSGDRSIYVAKFENGLTTLLYSVLLSGSSGDSIVGIAAQPDGRIYVTGTTAATDFPVAGTPVIPILDPTAYASFLTYLAPNGAVVDSTFWYGSKIRNDPPYTNTSYSPGLGGIAITGNDSVVIASTTTADLFPITSGASGTTPVTGAQQSSFISKFSFNSPCTYTVGASPITIPVAGGTVTGSVAAEAGCNWTISSGSDWIEARQTSPTQYSVKANAGNPTARTGRVYVAGKVITVNQASGCAFTVSPSTQSIPAAGGRFSITPTTGSTCAWTPVSSASWLRPAPGSPATLTGGVTLGVDIDVNYTSSARTATITVTAGVTVTFTQEATTCTYQINPARLDISANTPAASVTVTTQAGCRWEAGEMTPAATAAGPPYTAVTGSGQATFTVPANPGTTRTLRAFLAGQVVTATQYGTIGSTGNVPFFNPLPAINVSGSPQNILIKAQDGDGNTTISRIYFVINSTPTVPANVCHGYYERSANALYLYNDALTVALGPLTPGSISTLQNSQCTLFGGTSSVHIPAGGVTLDLTLGVALSGSLQANAQNIYGWINDPQGNQSGWTQLGKWSPAAAAGPSPPTLLPASATTLSGESQSVTMTGRDLNGYADINRVYFLINPNNSVPGNTCHGFYDRRANAIFLYSDGLTQALGPLTPGGPGRLENSQCAVDGAKSTVVLAAGTDLTFRFGFTLKAAYHQQAMNVYFWVIDATNTGTGWVNFASWTSSAPPVASTPEVVSGSPATPAGSPQTFTITVRDGNGFADIFRVYFQIYSSSQLQLNSCHGYYDPASNTFRLYNDALSAVSAALVPGSTSTVENTQCRLNAATSALVSATGSELVFQMGVSLKGDYGQTGKKVYFLAQDTSLKDSGWVQTSTWNPPLASAPSVPSPKDEPIAAYFGSPQPVAFTGIDLNGEQDIQRFYFLVHTTNVPGPNTCHGYYDRPTNGIYLYDNTLTVLQGPIILGTNTALRNSQCEISAANSRLYSRSSGELTFQLGIGLLGSFATRNQNIFGVITDTAATGIGWFTKGNWYPAPAGSQQSPIGTSSATIIQAGIQNTFPFIGRDANGYADVSRMYFLLNENSSIPKFTCHGFYERASNSIYLYNDALDGLIGPLTPGRDTVIQNSQCAINGSATRVIIVPSTDVVVEINFSLKGSYTSKVQRVYLWVVDSANAGTGWILINTWTPTPPAAPQPPAIAQVSTTGTVGPTQRYFVTVNDVNGYTDIYRVYFLIAPTAAISTNTCHAFYDRAINGIYLYDDALKTVSEPIAPGSNKSVQNSQCRIDGTAQSVASSGTLLDISFQATLLGSYAAATKNVYAIAQEITGAATPWTLITTLTPPVPQFPTIESGSPAAPSGSPQTFTFRLRDPQGYTDLRNVYFVVGPSPTAGATVCNGSFNPQNQFFYLAQDSTGISSTGPIQPGPFGTAENAMCRIEPSTSKRTGAVGTDVTFDLGLTLKQPYGSTTQNLYMNVVDFSSNETGWVKIATWTP